VTNEPAYRKLLANKKAFPLTIFFSKQPENVGSYRNGQSRLVFFKFEQKTLLGNFLVPNFSI